MLGPHISADDYLTATLRTLVAGELSLEQELGTRVALYHAFHRVWRPDLDWGEADERMARLPIDSHLQRLTPICRAAFLLCAMEGFTRREAAFTLSLLPNEVRMLVDFAYREIAYSLQTEVLIIEDSAMAVLELRRLLGELGHRVAGVAATHAQALQIIEKAKPGLILADAHLADGSSGVQAVAEIKKSIAAPVIFITGYPQKLAGLVDQDQVVIAKPFRVENLKSTIEHALLGQPLAA